MLIGNKYVPSNTVSSEEKNWLSILNSDSRIYVDGKYLII